MDIKRQITRINERIMFAKTEEESDAILSEKNAIMDAHPEMYDELYKYDAQDILQIARAMNLGKKMTPILETVNCAAIARKYFGKSRSWFMQRMNGNEVNGRRCYFSPDDVKVIKSALQDIASQIASVAESI